MTKTMRELLELRLAGLPLPPFDERNARRVYCPMCLDEGLIRIWHPKTVEEARKLIANNRPLTELRTHYDAVASCLCRVGDTWYQREVSGGGVRVFVPRFSEANHCKLLVSTANANDHETLTAWLSNWRPAGYTRAFDDFNRGDCYVNQEIEF